MKVILTGATGMVGKGVLLECLDQEAISQVLSISRKPLGLTHEKLKELIHEDFSEFESVRQNLAGYDACYACMGVSAAGISESVYFERTYGYTLALAKVLFEIDKGMTFNYVSGQGTDSSENGRSNWARVKGKTENDLLGLGFNHAFMFRPGAIVPKRGVEPSSVLYKRMINNFTWLLKLLKQIMPNKIVDTTQIGHAMIQVSSKGYAKTIIDPKDILLLSEEYLRN